MTKTELEKSFKKIFENNFEEFYIEITRKCNMKCRHCMRGDAQNITITKEIVDKFFAQTTFIRTLLITGGEPFLEPAMLDYIFDSIIKHNVEICYMNIVTNGTIRNKDIANSMTKMLKKSIKPFDLGLTFSDDQFHELSEHELDKSIQFYKENIKVVENAILEIRKFSDGNGDLEVRRIGRAEENDIVTIPESNRIMNHMFSFVNETIHFDGKELTYPAVKCPITLFANGNFGLDKFTFELGDQYAIGNILKTENTITEEIIKFNDYKCICTCHEAALYQHAKYVIEHKNNEISEESLREETDIYLKLKRLFEIREQLRNENPDLKFNDIKTKSELIYHEEQNNKYDKIIKCAKLLNFFRMLSKS